MRPIRACRRRMVPAFLALAAVLISAGVGLSLVTGSPSGTWPKHWPKELDQLRGRARTIGIATGIQQNIHEITFDDRETFEQAWPAILKVKTPGAPLTLYKVQSDPPKAWGSLLSNAKPAVRIYAPAESYVSEPTTPPSPSTREGMDRLVKEGVMLHAGPPWPADLISPKGELPEFVTSREVDGKLCWVDARTVADKAPHSLNRARVDIELVVDGMIIDLNRIPLPSDTPVIDKRF